MRQWPNWPDNPHEHFTIEEDIMRYLAYILVLFGSYAVAGEDPEWLPALTKEHEANVEEREQEIRDWVKKRENRENKETKDAEYEEWGSEDVE